MGDFWPLPSLVGPQIREGEGCRRLNVGRASELIRGGGGKRSTFECWEGPRVRPSLNNAVTCPMPG